MWKLLQVIFYILLLLHTLQVGAQKVNRIQYKADELYEFRKNGERIRRLVGNVVFTQETSIMYCDSALYYVKDNVMEAYGRVKIVDDSVTIRSNTLTYNGNDRMAHLRQNVVYTKGEKKLTTHFLDYHMENEVGNYLQGGQLQDSTNTLVSQTGYFYGKENYVIFWEKVVLEAPDYILKSDTLRYNTVRKIAIAKGRTEITTEDETILHAKGGEFRTELDQSKFIEGNIETIDYYMEGDQLFFDELRKYYYATDNVKLTAKNEDVIITGDKAYNDKRNNISKVYGHAVMRRVLESDTIYLSADTLVSIESEYDSAKRILAYNHVKVWRHNLQGLADSASYFLHDSLLYFYKDPVFWNRQNQIEGDTIMVEISEEQIKTMMFIQDSFLASEDTIQNYNQVKGRTMKAYFVESEISHIFVNGNGESIHYVLDEKDPDHIKTMGMNRILCSDITIRFKDQKPDNISFYVKPEAKFIPPHELTEDIQKLPGFLWKGDERPTFQDFFPGATKQTVLPKPDAVVSPPKFEKSKTEERF